MKLTKYTIPQAKNYQCEKCHVINNHKDMYNEQYCYECINLDTGELE